MFIKSVCVNEKSKSDFLEQNRSDNDYIKKPFSILELRARVEAHLRREHRQKQQVLSTNELKLFPQNSDISLLAELPKSGIDKL